MSGLLDYLIQLGQPWGLGQVSADRARRDAARKREEEAALHPYGELLTEPIIVHDEIERYEQEHNPRKMTFAERAIRYGDTDRRNIEDRRGEHPHVQIESGGTAPPPQGWPNGWDRTYDPRWLDPSMPGKLRPDLPPEVLQGMDEERRWRDLRDEREDLVDEQYEETDSPLVLRKRNPNGTITYVHALTGQPLFDEGLYGMNDPQGAEPESTWDDVFDPYWRGGRRDW